MSADKIRKLVKLRKQNTEHEEMINFLEMEQFEYSVKCQRLENQLSKVRGLVQKLPLQLVEFSEQLHTMTSLCSTLGTRTSRLSEAPTNNSTACTPVTSPPKPHVVRPHTVNGHVLFEPTITLNRVAADLIAAHSTPTEVNTRKRRYCLSPITPGNRQTTNVAHVSGSSNSSMQESSNELLEDTNVPGPSTSRSISHSLSSPNSPNSSHSLLLSGTFKDVKIYVNKIDETTLNELMNRSEEDSGTQFVNTRRKSKRRPNRKRV